MICYVASEKRGPPPTFYPDKEVKIGAFGQALMIYEKRQQKNKRTVQGSEAASRISLRAIYFRESRYRYRKAAKGEKEMILWRDQASG